MSTPITALYGTSVSGSATASEIAKNNVAKREYQKEYMDYWNSTAELTGTGRPVDAFISPLAPFPAPVPNKYGHSGKLLLLAQANCSPYSSRVMSGYAMFVNLLDYTASVIPVTTVDKNIDVVDAKFTPLNDKDAVVAKICKYSMYDMRKQKLIDIYR